MARSRTALDLLADDERRSVVAAGLVALEKRNLATSNLKDPTSGLLNSLSLPSKSGAAVNFATALTVSAVYACVQIISGTIARLPLKLYQKTARGREEISDHPVAQLIGVTPDGYRTSFGWRQMMEAAALLRGNGFSRIRRNSYFEVERLDWMDLAQTELWRTPDGAPFYRYRGEVLQPHEVMHHREMSLDGIIGLSPVTCMREQIGLAISTQEHGSRFFSNGASPGVILTAPITATKEQMDRIRDEVTKNHGGVTNSSKPFLAYGGLEVKSVSLSNADSQFLESRKFDIEEIARAFRVPLHLLQSTEKTTSWGSGVEQLNRGFVDFCLADRLERWEQELDLSMLSEAERRAGFYLKFNLKALLAGSAADRAEFYRTMRDIAAMNANEVRESEDMNNIPDHIGDRFDLPFNGTGGNTKDGAPADKAPAGDQAA